mgnify:CR=1 FL=1|jgi:hypothetical protein
MLPRTFFCLLFCSAFVAFAQNPVGVWEGSYFLQNSKKYKMNVRLEIFDSGPIMQGVVSTRGYSKGMVYGCDYVVYGTKDGNRIRMSNLNVRRGVVVSKEDCEFFQGFEVVFPKNDTSFTLLKGKWFWGNGWADNFTVKKTDSILSQSAIDDFFNYHMERYTLFEGNGVMLATNKRPLKNEGALQVDSSEVIIDINSIEKSEQDSISVLLNNEPITEIVSLYKKPLRIRLQQLNQEVSFFVIISESKNRKKIPLQLTIRQNDIVKEYTVEPGFVFNTMLLLKLKQK